jgi:hypothetical protein
LPVREEVAGVPKNFQQTYSLMAIAATLLRREQTDNKQVTQGYLVCIRWSNHEKPEAVVEFDYKPVNSKVFWAHNGTPFPHAFTHGLRRTPGGVRLGSPKTTYKRKTLPYYTGCVAQRG